MSEELLLNEIRTKQKTNIKKTNVNKRKIT